MTRERPTPQDGPARFRLPVRQLLIVLGLVATAYAAALLIWGDSPRTSLAQLQVAYEAAWTPVLQALHTSGQLRAPVKLSRLLMLGALNWSVQWFDRTKEASLDDLADAAVALFLKG